MRKLLLPILALSVMMPAVAHAGDPCRNAKGQFAKCGAPGSMTLAQYKAMKAGKAAATPTPTATSTAKPGLFGLKPTPKPSATPSVKPTPTPSASAKPGLMAKMKGMGKPKPKPTATTAAKPH